jgi:uncharacterized protein involved in oxidation of intracellular sulfur
VSGRILFILNDLPCGTERSYNGLRLAGALAKRGDGEVRVFLIGDAVGCAMANQKLPDGHYHLDRMIGACARHGADIGCCGTCMDARGITEDMLTKGTRRSSLDELADLASSFTWEPVRSSRTPGSGRSATPPSDGRSCGSNSNKEATHVDARGLRDHGGAVSHRRVDQPISYPARRSRMAPSFSSRATSASSRRYGVQVHW